MDYTTPAIVGIMTLFIAYSLFGFPKTSVDEVGQVIDTTKPNLIEKPMTLTGGHKMNTTFSDKMADSYDSNTYHLIGKNAIRLPNTDVFIDLAKF